MKRKERLKTNDLSLQFKKILETEEQIKSRESRSKAIIKTGQKSLKQKEMPNVESQLNRNLLLYEHFLYFKKCPLNSFFFKVFIYFWLRWVFVAVRGLSLAVASGGYSSFQCTGFSSRWLLLLRNTGSRCAGFSSCGSRALEHRLSSCGAPA